MVNKKKIEGEKPTEIIAAIMRAMVYIAIGIIIGTVV